jgi:hypothetical protein
MPVPTGILNGTTWNRYGGPVSYLTPSLSYSLTGFSPGYEICIGSSIWDWDNTGSETPTTISANLYQRWTDPSKSSTLVQGANAFHVGITIPAGSWYEYSYFINIGCAGWEVSTSNTYYLEAYASGTDGGPLVTANVAFSNVPSTTQLGTTHEGYIWVEGNNLCYVNANQWKHTIVGIDLGLGVVGSAGYLWLDTTDIINWIGADGHNYVIPWLKKQFQSAFSNSSTGTTYAGTSKVGYIWVDNQFGGTHLAFIASDGYKYLCGAGDNPY